MNYKQKYVKNIIIIFLHGLGRLTCSGIDALPSFPGASTISSSSRFVVEGMFRKSGVVQSFEMERWRERSQTKRDELALQEWGFCGRAGNPPMEKIITLKSKEVKNILSIIFTLLYFIFLALSTLIFHV